MSKRGGTFERGSGDGHGASTPRDRGVGVQLCGEVLVATDGGHGAVPEPTLGIGNNLGEHAVHLQHPSRGRGLPDRRADQGVPEPQLGADDREQLRLNRRLKGGKCRHLTAKLRGSHCDFVQRGATIERRGQQHHAGLLG